ncbi:hypothetical protein FB45DRAFT_1026237 [Roridomyces roridus]|uniref:Uncharacterized protein n=1 Tax=Roridomyces roridus TaxID=1738132 RepID=A0AAD7C0B0_9AGAR|nr:hypothetical protein FB45DRAFT_1026237 [Roridomyces roridus]
MPPEPLTSNAPNHGAAVADLHYNEYDATAREGQSQDFVIAKAWASSATVPLLLCAVFCHLVNRHRVLRNPLECRHRIRVHPSLLTTVDLLPRVVDPISLITAATRGTVTLHWPFEWILTLNM